MTQPDVENASAILLRNRLRGQLTGVLPADSRPRDTTDAYDIQDRLHVLLQDKGYGAVRGYKIGCTTPVMQAYLGIDQPCAGAIFETRLARGHLELALSDHGRLGVECEIAVELGRDLGGAGTRVDHDGAASAIAGWMASLEIVEDRYEDYESLDTPTLIADDFFHAACVTGPPVTPRDVADIGAVQGRLLIDGVEVGHGTGSDILGDPVEALVWLANHLSARGQTLPAGSVVTLGSVVKVVWIGGPCTAEAVFPALGSASVVFV